MPMMQLKVILPAQILLETTVIKIVAAAENGSFCLRPRHIDFVTALVPSILTYVSVEESEQFLAIDEGILVKCGAQVRVSTQHAVASGDLSLLQATVQQQFRRLNAQENLTRSALSKLEVTALRRFVDLTEQGD